jgi:hypothetical protein
MNSQKFLFFTTIISLILIDKPVIAQYPVFRGNPVTVDFSKNLRTWDGFGFNYVETAQTIDYEANPTDYGGFSILPEESRNEIIDLVFGDEGLKVGLVKMFLDPFQQKEQGGVYDHTTTTRNMRGVFQAGIGKNPCTGRRSDNYYYTLRSPGIHDVAKNFAWP